MRKRLILFFSLGVIALCLLSACRTLIKDSDLFTSNSMPDWIVIETTQEGVYKISLADIRKAGIDIAEIQPGNLELWQRGETIPFHVAEKGKTLLFYAGPPTSDYSAKNFYWLFLSQDRDRIKANLSIDPPQRENDLSLIDTTIPVSAATKDRILIPLRLEENLMYTPQADSGDHWLWEAYTAPDSRSIEIDLPNADGGNGYLNIWVWARTEGPEGIDHHWQIGINDQFIADHQWDGRGQHPLSFLIPAGVLHPGINRLDIRAIHDTTLKADIVYLDKIELKYNADAQPVSDRMAFYSIGDSLYLRDFSGPIFGIKKDHVSGETTILGIFENGNSLATVPGDFYWFAGPNDLKTPAAIYPAWIDPELLSDNSPSPANYLVIAPEVFLSHLEPLLRFHTSQGLITRSASVESIYNQINGGYPEPQAIQRYIKFLTEINAALPKYLLLVGDSTYDPRGYLKPPPTHQIPAYFVETIYGGQTASDVPFTNLDGDDHPDVTVGRVPANTPEQVQSFVRKTLAYARQEFSDESRSILAIADGQDPSFVVDASRFLEFFPSEIKTHLLNPPAGTEQASRQVIDGIRQGHWLVAYFGHGSIDTWGRDALLTASDVDELDEPAAMTIVVNMTCLTGLFTHPELESLAEKLLFQEPGGAVAVLAPTSLTLPTDQSYLVEALTKGFMDHSPVILGDVVLNARRSIPLDYPGSKDVLLTFLLFGDPALRIR